MNYVLTFILSYLIGSLPTAYLFLKAKGIDIRDNGSGNVGAMNSFEVSKSKVLGISVFIIDFAKGLIAVSLSTFLFGNSFMIVIVSLLFVVIGHCFSVWINFRGGKGLATAAGGAIVSVPVMFYIWIILWVAGYLIKKKINYANILATIFTLVLSFTSAKIINEYNLVKADSELEYGIGCALVLLIILSKHLKDIKKYLKIK